MNKVLIIDDDYNIVTLISELLSLQGYHPIKALNGNEGIRLLDSKNPPDLVITDLNMLGIKGKEVIQVIRQNPNFDDVPIMIVTGSIFNDHDFPEEGSYQTIMNKPFDVNELLAKVKELMTK